MHYGRRAFGARERPPAAGSARRPGAGRYTTDEEEEEEEEVDSWALDYHFVARGVFRAVYVACWLTKSARPGPPCRPHARAQ
jgi:hypothetical protein